MPELTPSIAESENINLGEYLHWLEGQENLAPSLHGFEHNI